VQDETLDASALIAYYGREPGWNIMARLFAAARRDRAHLAVHAVNVGEVYYRAYRRAGEARLDPSSFTSDGFRSGFTIGCRTISFRRWVA